MGNTLMNHKNERKSSGRGIVGFIVRFVVAAFVLMIASWLVPGFVVAGFTTAIVAALIIAAADYLIQRVFGFDASPFGRGISGFLVSVAIIYVAQFFVTGMGATLWGAVIAALIIGLIDMLLPTKFL